MKLSLKVARIAIGLLVAGNVIIFATGAIGVVVLESNRRKMADSDSSQVATMKQGGIQAVTAIALFGLANLILSVPLMLHHRNPNSSALRS